MTFNETDRNGIAASDRRASARTHRPGPVKIGAVGKMRTGFTEDSSAEGLFVVLDEPLQVEVLLPGAEAPVLGSLVRITGLPGSKSGLGIELVGARP